jgi:hypothetical protein
MLLTVIIAAEILPIHIQVDVAGGPVMVQAFARTTDVSLRFVVGRVSRPICMVTLILRSRTSRANFAESSQRDGRIALHCHR